MMNTIPPFTASHAALLARFLSSPQRPKDTLNYPQLAGFLFAIANGPELISPSEWIPMVFNDQEARYETHDEAEQVLQAMMALYNDCGQARTGGSASLPSGCEIRPAPLDNFDAAASFAQCLGEVMPEQVDFPVFLRRQLRPIAFGECFKGVLPLLHQ